MRPSHILSIGDGDIERDLVGEHEVCRMNAKRVTEKWPVFEILESLLWEPQDGYYLLDRHLDRMAGGADYFQYPFDREKVRVAMLAKAAAFTAEPIKVRVMLAQSGEVVVEGAPAGVRPPAELVLAATPVDSQNPFLYYKTTNRAVYTEALANRTAGNDVILYNERGEVTEASSSNLVFQIEGRLVTPPVSAGLLGGTFRAELLEGGQVEEGTVLVDDLKRCERVWLINSVRRWLDARLLAASEVGS